MPPDLGYGIGWQFGIVVTVLVSCSTPVPVSTGMGDCVRVQLMVLESYLGG